MGSKTKIDWRDSTWKMTLKAVKEENQGYFELLDGHTADMLREEEREKVRALVKELEKADEDENA